MMPAAMHARPERQVPLGRDLEAYALGITPALTEARRGGRLLRTGALPNLAAVQRREGGDICGNEEMPIAL